jgi:hypothetical protein
VGSGSMAVVGLARVDLFGDALARPEGHPFAARSMVAPGRLSSAGCVTMGCGVGGLREKSWPVATTVVTPAGISPSLEAPSRLSPFLLPIPSARVKTQFPSEWAASTALACCPS